MAEQPGPISFAPTPFGASVGPPGGPEPDLFGGMAQAGTESITGRAGIFPSFLADDPRSEREIAQGILLRANQAIPGQDISSVLGRAVGQEVASIKLRRLEVEAREKRKKAILEDARGLQIARSLARVRGTPPESLLHDEEAGLVSKFTEGRDALEGLEERREKLSFLQGLARRIAPFSDLPIADRVASALSSRMAEDQSIIEREGRLLDVDATPLNDVKDILVGDRLLTELDRASFQSPPRQTVKEVLVQKTPTKGTGRGNVAFNARKEAKDFRAFLDAADPETVRAMAKNQLEGAVARKKSLPSPFVDAFLASPLGSRSANLFSRGIADGLTFGFSETGVMKILGERGVAEEIEAGGGMFSSDGVAYSLGLMGGMMKMFSVAGGALRRRGLSPRTLPQRVAVESVLVDLPRVPAIVVNGRAQNLSDEQIVKQIGVELGMGMLAGTMVGLGGAAASFGKREVARMTANAGRGLSRIVRESPEKLSAVLDVFDTFGQMITTGVAGVSGQTPRAAIRSVPELRRAVLAAADEAGLSAAQLANNVRLVSPGRGKSGKLDKLTSRELREVFEQIHSPTPAVPRGTRLQGGEDHMFFAVPAGEADALRRVGEVPLGTRFHGTPAAASLNVKGKAEVFAVPARIIRSTKESAASGSAANLIELPALSKIVQGGRTGESLARQIRGFHERGEQFGMDAVQVLATEEVPLSIGTVSEGLGAAGKAVKAIGDKRRAVLPVETLRSKAYAEGFYGIARNMIEARAPKNGRILNQMMDQYQDIMALKGKFKEGVQDLTHRFSAREYADAELMMGGHKPRPAPDDTSPAARAFRELKQNDNEAMDIMESTNPDGSLVRKLDGTPFARRDVHMPQPPRTEIREVVNTFSTVPMRLDEKGVWQLRDRVNVQGKLLKSLKQRQALYNRFIEKRAEEMRRKGMRYDRHDRKLIRGGNSKPSLSTLKREVRRFYAHHRDVALATSSARINTPTWEQIIKERPAGEPVPKRFGSVDFARAFTLEPEFIRPDLADNRLRHIEQLFSRRAEGMVFGENLEKLAKVGRDIHREVGLHLGDPVAQMTDDTIGRLYARETGNLEMLGAINALDKVSNKSAALVRTLTGANFLGPGSTFQIGGNGIWAVFGAAARLPIRTTMKTFGFADFAVGGTAAVLGSKLGDSLGDTPEEKLRNARLLMLAGFGAGFGSMLLRDTTSRALVPAMLPNALALGGASLDPDASPVHKGLMAAGGFLLGSAASRPRVMRRFAASPSAVKASKQAGAIDVGGIPIAQSDLATNDLLPAFLPDKFSRISREAGELLFGVTQAWEIWARASSAQASASAAGEMVQRLAANPALRNQPAGKFFLRELRRMGLKRKTVQDIIENNDAIIPDPLFDRVMRRGVENTQYVVRAMDLPLMWSSPWGRVFTQFMGMGLRQFENTTRYAFQEAGYGNWWPFWKILPMSVMAGLGVQELRDLINGRDLEPRAINKLTRAVQILGPGAGLFGDAARGLARFVETGKAGEALLDVVSPAAVDATKNVVDALVASVKAVVSNDPDIRRGRTGLSRAFGAVPGVKTIERLAERDNATDADMIRQFEAQLKVREREVLEARDGVPFGSFLEQLPEAPPGALSMARKLAERAMPAVEDTVRNVASGIGFLPIAPSKRSAEEKRQAILDRMKDSAGVFQREAERISDIKGPSREKTTPGKVAADIVKRARADTRGVFIDGVVAGIRDRDSGVAKANIKRYAEAGGTGPDLMQALRRRATTQRDSSLATGIPEKDIHVLTLSIGLRTGRIKRLDLLQELERSRNLARIQAINAVLRESSP